MTEDRLAKTNARFSQLLGIRIISVTADELIAEMTVTEEMANNNGVLHGGAIMSLADHCGGVATIMNLPQGKATTTIESKTNFIRPIAIGDVAHARCVALHVGNKTQIWQTSISRSDGKLAAMVTQTQMVLEWQTPKG